MRNSYDIGIVGAGIAGASLAILMAKKGYRTVVFEKDVYPKHRVCGEYISMESWDFLNHLGLDLASLNPPKINSLLLTAQSGYSANGILPLGGFGLSRYVLDHALSNLMTKHGVDVFMNTKVFDASKNKITTADGMVTCNLIVGAFGKYPPAFAKRSLKRSAKNYVGVKYHVKTKSNFQIPDNQIALHSFDGGYCGVSKVENGQYCLCYLVEAEKLNQSNNRIDELEQKVLSRNHHLGEVFENTISQYDKPQVISNIQFNVRNFQGLENQMIHIGDAAGSISPLSGNGMSIAARSAVLLYQSIEKNGLQFDSISNTYQNAWKQAFGSRIQFANVLNSIMLSPKMNDIVLRILNKSPFAKKKMINSMHGNSIMSLLEN